VQSEEANVRMLSDEHRMAYAFYMGGLTFAQVADVLGVSPQYAQDLVRRADNHIDYAVKSHERELHKESPRAWYFRRPLLVREDLLASYYGFEAKERYDRPIPHGPRFDVHLVVPIGRSWRLACDDEVKNQGTDTVPWFKLPRDMGWTRIRDRVNCKECLEGAHGKLSLVP